MDILTLAIAKSKSGSANGTITTENIINALGYKPADQEDVSQLSEEKVTKPNTATVGQTIVVKAVDEKGKPTEWECADMPSSGVTSWNDLEDKPFYEEIDEITLLENFTFEDYNNENILTPALNFIPNNVYKVVWNDDVYDNLICYFDGDYNIIASQDNGCPFYIDDDGNGLYIEGSEDETWTVSIIEKVNKIHQIDEKYIADSVKTHDWNTLKNRPFGVEIAKKYIIEEQTINFDSNGRGNVSRVEDWYNFVQVGQEYTVEFDGVSYTGTVYEDGDVCYRTDFTTIDGIDVYMYDCYGIVSSQELTGEHTIKLSVIGEIVTQIDDKYIPENIARIRDVDSKMDKNNPTGNGALSIGRQNNSLIGTYSQATGIGVMATSKSQNVIGEYNIGVNDIYSESISELKSYNTSSKIYISENYTFDSTTGNFTLTSPFSGKANTIDDLVSTNISNNAKCFYMLAGETTSSTMYKIYYNIYNPINNWQVHGDILYLNNITTYKGVMTRSNRGKYVHIVGNGTSNTERSNAHTLDWNGNAWYQGTVEGTAMIIKSSTEGSSKRFKITVGDDGLLTATEITE